VQRFGTGNNVVFVTGDLCGDDASAVHQIIADELMPRLRSSRSIFEGWIGSTAPGIDALVFGRGPGG
jgi:hypothetical protein